MDKCVHAWELPPSDSHGKRSTCRLCGAVQPYRRPKVNPNDHRSSRGIVSPHAAGSVVRSIRELDG